MLETSEGAVVDFRHRAAYLERHAHSLAGLTLALCGVLILVGL